MALHLHRLLQALTPAAMDPHRPPARAEKPECIVLPPLASATPSSKPPVRIFLGTERSQFRAERVFLWSVEKHRDPGRQYEIYLMRELAGFRRGYWLTGFTNYRFAIPEFAGFQGRAIYNDTDQVYLADPAELFDQDMGRAGFLSINDRDTSVMLIDCKRMARIWHPKAVRRRSRKRLEADARAVDSWGELNAGWNARDSEYRAGESKLVHFTTLHTQPWRPFPDQFVYSTNPTDPLWPDLEAECNAARYWPRSADQPSERWSRLRPVLEQRVDWPALKRVLRGSSGADAERICRVDGLLELVPDDDLGWVLERLFSQAHELQLEVHEPLLARAGRERRPAWFWQQHLELAAALFPRVRWTFLRRTWGELQILTGGPAIPGRILVLTHRKPGHNHNAVALGKGLAERTRQPLDITPIPWSERRYVVERMRGQGDLSEVSGDTRVIVASGWLATRVARRLACRLGPDTRLVLLGRKAGRPPANNGLLVQCQHYDLPVHPQRLQTLLPLNAGQVTLPEDRDPWQDWLDAPYRVALLVGGDTRAHSFRDPERLARAASAWAREQGARLLVVTSRRTADALPALRAGLGADDLLHQWRPNDPTNPYGLALTQGHGLIVTGESESMLADAVSTAQPTWIWPLQPLEGDRWQRLQQAIASQAQGVKYNARGSIMPQQGLRYICARLIERGWVLPPRNLEAMHEALIKVGRIAYFGSELPSDSEPFLELEPVTETLVSRLGLTNGS